MRLRPQPSSSLVRGALASILAVVGSVAAVVGGHDAFLDDASLGTVLIGILAMLAGGIAVSGAIVVLAKPQQVEQQGTGFSGWRGFVVVAFACSTLLALYVLAAALRAEHRNALVVPLATLALLAGVAGIVYFGRGIELKLGHIGASVLGFAGTIFAAWQLWYTNEYVPSRAGASVQLAAEITAVDTSGERSTGRLTLTTTNRSSSDVIAVGSAYTLLGTTLAAETEPASSDRAARPFQGVLRDPQVSRFSRATDEQPPALLGAGKFVGDRETLKPGAAQTRRYVVAFPSGCYDVVRLRAEVFAVGDIDLTLTKPPVVRRSRRDGHVYMFWAVDPGSWLGALVEAPYRWVVIRYEVPEVADLTPSDFIRVTARFPEPSWDEDPPSLKAAEELFTVPVADSERLSEVYAADEVPADGARVGAQGRPIRRSAGRCSD